MHLGDTHLAAGQPAAARLAWTEAERLLTALDHPSVSGVRESLRRLDDVVGADHGLPGYPKIEAAHSGWSMNGLRLCW